MDRVADVLALYRAVVHATYSSTPERPRCRVVLHLAEPVDAATYERAHTVVRGHLRAAGIVADEGAKDASRVSYSPVVPPGTAYRVRVVDGSPLDARAVLAAQPPVVRPSASAPRAPACGDVYARAALRRARSEERRVGKECRP